MARRPKKPAKPYRGVTGKTRNQIALMNASTKNKIKLAKADRYGQRLQNKAAATAGAGKTARFVAGTSVVSNVVDDAQYNTQMNNEAAAKRDAAQQANQLVSAFESIGQTGGNTTTEYGGGAKYVNE